MSHLRRLLVLALFLTLTVWSWPGLTQAWAAEPAVSVRDSRVISVPLGRSTTLSSAKAIKRLSVANPECADILLISPHQAFVTAKKMGTTTVSMWTGNEELSAVYQIVVSVDVLPLKETLHQVLPDEPDLKVYGNNDSVTLAGMVSSATAVQTALSIAQSYVDKPEKVINVLSVGGVHQVMLEVRVAELARELARQLNFNFNINDLSNHVGLTGLSGPQSFWNVLNGLIRFDDQGKLVYNANKLSGAANFKTGRYNITAFIDAHKDDGVIKVLSEPNLVCLSGQSANFLAGGEIPVPVPQGLGTVAIEWKPFGVGLSFTPKVVGKSRISMEVFPEVSELDFTNAITISGIVVPAITTRRAKTTVELEDGQTYAIAGLIKDNMRETLKKYPAVGDIPILGALFRSSEYQSNKTELVIFVTPRLVKPITNLAAQSLPTDNFKEPNDLEWYLLGVTDGLTVGSTARKRAAARAAAAAPTPTGGFDGDFGHTLPEQP